MQNNYTNIDFLFSTDCNMACQYCYIEKNKKQMIEFNNELRKFIINGNFIKNFVKNFTEKELLNIKSISLWGAEPTINADYFHNFLGQIFEVCPNVNSILFSTNSYLGYEYIKKFLDAIEYYIKKYNKHELYLHLQFSLDGPPEINDESRKKGATQKTIDTIYSICNNFTENYSFNIELGLKPTLDLKYIKEMISNEKKIKNYFSFFLTLKKEVNKILENKNDKKLIHSYIIGYPTLVLPGEYTSQDGKDYAKWILSLAKYNNFDYDFQHRQTLRVFSKLLENLDFNNYTFQNFYDITCGAGKGSLCFDHRGKCTCCHHTANQSVYKNKPGNSNIIDNFSTFTGTSIEKITYNVSFFHNNTKNLFEYFKIMVIELAKNNQIESIYINDENAQKILFLIYCSIYCYIGEINLNKELYFFSPSIIRLLGNGAMEALIYYGLKKGLIEFK